MESSLSASNNSHFKNSNEKTKTMTGSDDLKAMTYALTFFHLC